MKLLSATLDPAAIVYEYHTEDKSGWPDGPWKREPDKLTYTDQGTGLACMIFRNRRGVLCGYVAVDDSHPWFGVKYSQCMRAEMGEDCPAPARWGGCEHRPEFLVSVHGGLSYSAFCEEANGVDQSLLLCHIPAPGQPERVWWFGYDTGHALDFAPADSMWDMLPASIKEYLDFQVYRDLAYIKQQNASLARQLAAIR